MIRSKKTASEIIGIQSHCRSLALWQIEMLTRVAEISLQPAEGAVGRMIAEVRDPARIPGLEAGLAVRLREFDVAELLDTECTFTVADHVCRSLGIGPYAEDPPDTG